MINKGRLNTLVDIFGLVAPGGTPANYSTVGPTVLTRGNVQTQPNNILYTVANVGED